jgi:hypothetical protein
MTRPMDLVETAHYETGRRVSFKEPSQVVE